MNLTFKERFVFGGLFPKNYNLVEGMIMKDIKTKIEISQEEFKEANIKTVGTQSIWDANKTKDKDIIFTEMEINFLKERVKELDKDKKIDNDTFELSQKIMKA